MSLNSYLQQVQRYLRDVKQELLDPTDLIEYINRARREVAQRAQCVRITPPISGSVTTIDISDAGTGYTDTPTITISPPDFPSGQPTNPNGLQATATAIVNNGVIQSIDVTNGGYGYFQPTITITDDTGTGAAATANVSWINVLNQGQERYDFADMDLTSFPGVQDIIAVKSVSILYSNWRYSLASYSWSTYQAKIRQFPYQYQYVPAFFTQYGQGSEGTLFLYPIPSQTYQVEMDLLCTPAPLTDDLSPEVIPQPWCDAVPFLAAYYAYLEIQNFNAAKFHMDQFDSFMHRFSAYARPGRRTNPYGRW